MTDIVDNVLQIMKQQYEKDLSIFEGGFLLNSIAARQREAGVQSVDDYARRLAGSAEEAEALLSSFRITFTDFFRDPIVFAHLERHILPELIRRKADGGNQEIRVWSAGCASGQEAYSLAMLLNEQRQIHGERMRFRIFATDIAPEALAVASAGTYDRAALRNVRLQHVEKYFHESGDRFEISKPIRQIVSFSVYDLLDEASAHPAECIYGDFDLIFCSNLLFYYQPSQQQFIIRKLLKALATDGYLVTGDTESITIERITRLRPLALAVPIFRRPKQT